MIAAERPPTTELPDVPEHWPVGLREYHQDRTCESNSSLQAFVADRWTYYLRYVRGIGRAEFSSPEMDFGTAVHLGITVKMGLTDETWADEQTIVIPDDKTRASQAGIKLKQQYPNNPVLSNDDVARCHTVVEAVFSPHNKDIRDLLERGGAAEHAIRWKHASGLGLKCSFDILQDDGLVIDIKTASNPRPFGYKSFDRAVRDYGYDKQAALYTLGRDLYREYLPADDEDTGFKWLVVGTEFPYYCRLYTPSVAMIRAGRQWVETVAAELAAKYEFADCEEVWLPDDHGIERVIDARSY